MHVLFLAQLTRISSRVTSQKRGTTDAECGLCLGSASHMRCYDKTGWSNSVQHTYGYKIVILVKSSNSKTNWLQLKKLVHYVQVLVCIQFSVLLYLMQSKTLLHFFIIF